MTKGVTRRLGKQQKKATNLRLPSPPRRPEEEWLPAVRSSGKTVPFGYEADPEDNQILLPVIRELELLEHAKELLREYSLRTVAQWLTEKSGRYISHVGLSKRIKLEHNRKTLAGQARRYERLYKEARAKAEALENKIGGKAIRSHAQKDKQAELRREQKAWDEEYGTSED